MMKYIYSSILVAMLGIFNGFSQTINLQQVIGSGITSPIGAYFAPGNDSIMYILQQTGRIKVANVNTGVVSGTDFLNVTSKLTSSGNEQGLLGMAFHPNYASNGYFFINYTKTGGGATVVARYKRNVGNPLTADIASEDIVMQVTQPFSNHNGGQLQFGRDGYLYIGLGDGGSGGDPNGNGQNKLVRLAKMMRVAVEDSGYSVPADNPFVGNASYLPEIWSIGLRNPWRYSFDMVTADLWIADVGQELWEEIDFEPANTGGRNYGWRCYEGNVTYNTSGCGAAPNYTPPVYVFSSGAGSGNCSVTGGFVYRGGTYGELYGKYIFTDYCSGKFWTMEPNGLGGWTTNQVTTTPQLTYQLSSFGQDGKGEMYAVSREGNKIYKLTGVLCAPSDIYSSTGSLVSCTGSIELHAPYSASNSYAWYRNDTLLSETSSVLNTPLSGTYKVLVENIANSCGDSTIAAVTVYQPTPVDVFLPAAVYCEDAAAVNIVVSPNGGTLSGAGVSGSTFNPNGLSGNQDVIYTYTSANNCTYADTFHVTVNPVPTVTFQLNVPAGGYCLDEQIALTAQPAGGSFLGTGVTGTTFFAATAGVGTHTITYNYTDGNNCANSASVNNVLVSNCYTSIDEENPNSIAVFPNPFTDEIQIPLDGQKNITVLTVDGKVVYQNKQTANNVSLGFLSEGTYILHVEQDGKIYKRVIVKAK